MTHILPRLFLKQAQLLKLFIQDIKEQFRDLTAKLKRNLFKEIALFSFIPQQKGPVILK